MCHEKLFVGELTVCAIEVDGGTVLNLSDFLTLLILVRADGVNRNHTKFNIPVNVEEVGTETQFSVKVRHRVNHALNRAQQPAPNQPAHLVPGGSKAKVDSQTKIEPVCALDSGQTTYVLSKESGPI